MYLLYKLAMFESFSVRGNVLYLHVALIFVVTDRLNWLTLVATTLGYIYMYIESFGIIMGVMLSELFTPILILIYSCTYPIFPAMSNAFTHNSPVFVEC